MANQLDKTRKSGSASPGFFVSNPEPLFHTHSNSPGIVSVHSQDPKPPAVEYTLADGKKQVGILIKKNSKTAWINPFRWIKTAPIKVHLQKNKVKILIETESI